MTPERERQTVGATVRGLIRHPVRRLVRQWNWKSALLSALIRASIFFLTNLTAGWHAALGAAAAELVLRSTTSGFYGTATEALSSAQPHWAAMAAAVIGLPFLSHSLEILVHWLRGTPNLGLSIVVSMSFTAISSAFNLYAMRRGVLIMGHGSKSLGDDLCQVPALLVSFIMSGPRAIGAWCCRLACPRRSA